MSHLNFGIPANELIGTSKATNAFSPDESIERLDTKLSDYDESIERLDTKLSDYDESIERLDTKSKHPIPTVYATYVKTEDGTDYYTATSDIEELYDKMIIL